MKIVQINAWMGQLGTPLARFIEAEKPDILCMQETILPNNDVIPSFTHQFNFLDEIRRAGSFKDEFFAKGWGFDLGSSRFELGSVILSKYPISNHQEFHPYGTYHVRTNNSDSQPNTQAWQACTLTLPGGTELQIANYHGYLEDLPGEHGIGTETTVEVMRKVAERLAALPHPLIFCGDLNIWPESPAFRELDSLGLRNLIVDNNLRGTLSPVHRATDSDRHTSTPDHILVSPEIKIGKFYVSDELVSDHKGLVLEFEV